MSTSSLSMGIFPMVFLKKSSSMVLGVIDLREGSINNSLPNRNGCVGYAVAMYLLSVICAWSCSDVTLWKSRRDFMSLVELAKTEMQTKNNSVHFFLKVNHCGARESLKSSLNPNWSLCQARKVTHGANPAIIRESWDQPRGRVLNATTVFFRVSSFRQQFLLGTQSTDAHLLIPYICQNFLVKTSANFLPRPHGQVSQAAILYSTIFLISRSKPLGKVNQRLTGFEDDDALEAGELGRVDLHLLELSDDFLQGANLCHHRHHLLCRRLVRADACKSQKEQSCHKLLSLNTSP